MKEGEGSREEKGEKRMHQRTGDETSKIFKKWLKSVISYDMDYM